MFMPRKQGNFLTVECMKMEDVITTGRHDGDSAATGRFLGHKY